MISPLVIEYKYIPSVKLDTFTKNVLTPLFDFISFDLIFSPNKLCNSKYISLSSPNTYWILALLFTGLGNASLSSKVS